MANVAVSLSDPFASFVDEKVRSGEFQSHTEVVEQALSLLQSDEEKLKRLRDAIQVGLDDFEAGRYVEVDDVEAWLNTLGRDPA
ncbi:type II toxin-antitoxin system ParD family antitoxin [Brevundimonas sp.]